MKKKLFSIFQFLIIFAGLGIYWGYSFKKKQPLIHIVSDSRSNLKYDIQYLSKDKIRFNNDIKVLLSEVHDALKVDLVQSDIYNFNQHDCTPYFLKYPYTSQILRVYKDVYFHSNGLYDPTLEFFLKKIRDKYSIIQTKDFEKTKYQNLFLESKPFIDFDYIMVNNNRLKKLKNDVCLNLDHIIRACQAKNLSDFFKSKSIKNFYFIMNHEIVTSGFRDGKKKNWRIVYSVPVKVKNKKIENTEDENSSDTYETKNKNVKIIFSLQNKSISVFNNTESLPSLENFYVSDLIEFEKCEEEMKLYIKQCAFVFYKHPVIKENRSFYKFLLSRAKPENQNLLYQAFDRLKKKSKDHFKTFVWTTDQCVYQPFANYSNEDLIQFLNTQSFKKKLKVQRDEKEVELIKKLRIEMKRVFLDFFKSEDYKKNLFANYKTKSIHKDNDKRFSDIKFEKSKNVLIDPHNGEIFSPKYICGFVISDNPILSKCLSLSCSMNDFSNANEIFEKFKNHQCDYFVLYQDEEKNLYYKSSKQLKVKIDNYRYLISL